MMAWMVVLFGVVDVVVGYGVVVCSVVDVVGVTVVIWWRYRYYLWLVCLC